MTTQRDWYRQGMPLLREVASTKPPEGGLAFWSIGQAGFILKWGDTVAYIDPVLADLTYPDGRTRRHFAPPFAPEDARADYVFITHDHLDHLNLDTLVPMAQANPTARFVLPKGLTHRLTDHGIPASQVVGVSAGQPLCLPELAILPFAAAHEEYITDAQGEQLCMGFLLTCGAVRLFHGGDTLLTDRLARELEAAGPVDIAFLPINGADWERRFRGVLGNMNARDAAYLAHLMRADLVIPYHFDMVMGNRENPVIFAQYMQELYPCDKYHIMMLGERFLYLPPAER